MSRDRGSILIKFGSRLTVKDWRLMIDQFEKVNFIIYPPYLLVGAINNDFNWHYGSLNKEELCEIIETKIPLGERIAFHFAPRDNPTSAITICNQIGEQEETLISFFLPDDVKVIDGGILTDFSAYIKIITPICYQISAEFDLNCNQYIDRM